MEIPSFFLLWDGDGIFLGWCSHPIKKVTLSDRITSPFLLACFLIFLFQQKFIHTLFESRLISSPPDKLGFSLHWNIDH